MKPKDAIKVHILQLDKSETYQEENVLPEDSLYKYLYQRGEERGDEKRQASDFILVIISCSTCRLAGQVKATWVCASFDSNLIIITTGKVQFLFFRRFLLVLTKLSV